MTQDIDINEVLKALREQIGILAQENAILKATIKKIEDERSSGNCACSKNN